MKYNLTFWQRLALIPMRFIWLLWDPKTRKTWHEVKKGMEKHQCKFTKPFTHQGYQFLQCEHEGCNICEMVDLQEKGKANTKDETKQNFPSTHQSKLQELEMRFAQVQNELSFFCHLPAPSSAAVAVQVAADVVAKSLELKGIAIQIRDLKNLLQHCEP